MTIHDEAVEIDNRGDIFTAYGTYHYDTDNPAPGSMFINLSNQSGEWVDFQLQEEYPGREDWTSGHIDDGGTSAYSDALKPTAVFKLTRWRPGVFGIPGNGGGELHFLAKDRGDLTINVTCVG